MVHVDRELYQQRRRNGNGNGNGGGWQKWPWSAMVALFLAIVGWIVTTIIWAARQESDLATLKANNAEAHARFNVMAVQLEDIARRMVLHEERQAASTQRNNEQDARMERIEGSTRRSAIIEERQQQVIRRLDAIVQYLQQNSNFRLQSEESRPERR